MQFKSFLFSAIICTSAFGLLSCSGATTKKGTVGVERQQMLLVSEAEMQQGAKEAYGQILAEAKKNKTLNTDPVMLKRIRTVADRLIPQTKIFREDAPSWNWEVNLLK